MGLGLSEYLDSLDERRDLIWPQPPPPIELKATPAIAPLQNIKAVTWSVYGTLLRIDQGHLWHLHPQELRMQIALEKTIKEFNMWNSMSRKPGQPWEYLLRQYSSLVEDARLRSTKQKGDVPEVDSMKIWKKLIERLIQNEYQWDHDLYGDLDQLAIKVAYFFHASMQGTAASDHAAETLMRLTQAGIRQGLLADGQAFTLAQLLRDLRRQTSVRTIGEVLASEVITLSYQIGVAKPSRSLYEKALSHFKEIGIGPRQILHVSHRLGDDLAIAKKCGFHTALYAADGNCCRVQRADLRHPEWKPDRLITEISQLLQILCI